MKVLDCKAKIGRDGVTVTADIPKDAVIRTFKKRFTVLYCCTTTNGALLERKTFLMVESGATVPDGAVYRATLDNKKHIYGPV